MDPAFYKIPYTFQALVRFNGPNFSKDSFEKIKAGLLTNGWTYEFKFERDVSVFTATYYSQKLYHLISRPISEENQRAQDQLQADFECTFNLISIGYPAAPISIDMWVNETLGCPWNEFDARETPPRRLDFRHSPYAEQEGSSVHAMQRFSQSLTQAGLSMSQFSNALGRAFVAPHITPQTPAPPPSWNELAARYAAPVPPPPAKQLPRLVHVRCGVRKITRATP